MRRDEILQRLFRQIAGGNRCGKRFGNGVAGGGSVINRVERVTPPLQADQSDLRFTHHMANTRDLEAESIKRKEMRLLAFGCK